MNIILSNIENNNKINYNNTVKSFKSGNFIANPNFKAIITIINSYFDILNRKKGIKYIINTPTYTITNNVINIKVLYYVSKSNEYKKSNKNKTFTNNHSININYLLISSIISKIVNKKVNLEITRINYPYINSIIFAKFLSHNSNYHNYLHFQDQILLKTSFIINKIPSYITGIKIIISGRIVTERKIPRKTTKIISYGSFKGIDNIIIDYNKYTNTNRYGSYTFKVWICQRISIRTNK